MWKTFSPFSTPGGQEKSIQTVKSGKTPMQRLWRTMEGKEDAEDEDCGGKKPASAGGFAPDGVPNPEGRKSVTEAGH